jgi:hypothetical protein
MERIGESAVFLDRKRRLLRPRFTVVLHQIRDELGLSMISYAVIDSIHVLSHSTPDHFWCTMSKEELGKFLHISRRTVFNAITEGLNKGLLEKNDGAHLRTTLKWAELVTLYSPRKE